MTFEWDEAKNRANIATHGISFEDACLIFDGPVYTKPDLRFDYKELRKISLGIARDVKVIVVVHTDRSGTTRLISARRANRKERRDYDEKIPSRINA